MNPGVSVRFSALSLNARALSVASELSVLSLSVMAPVKFMMLGVASPFPLLGSLSQRMVIVSLLSAAASSVMVMSRLAWVSPAGTVMRASPPERKFS